ncbi:uncharacterized protein LOC110039967 [Orbicella faveolata]|uniref:uncharacterized protein LOC110039967 n=1 Tax=Orbicella faveolata TaxID=48498 RepID=UPI0009E25D2B|nr:uncharacterized protein LOC110039967 [Orbicella faveolata]
MHSYLSKEQRESYLRELFYSSFSDRRASVAVRNEEVRSLAKHLRKLYSLVEIGKGLSPDAESALKEIIKFCTKGRPGFYEAKMMADYKKLLFFRGQREEMERSIQEQQCFQCIHKKKKPLAVLREDDWYWGTKQQLRCGEIIADTLGGLDPAFGVLLHPAGGRTELANPNNKQFRITGKEKEEIEAILYHTATHDACGYLSEYHKIGPGYNYLGTMLTVFPTCIPQSGRLAALMFWKKLINEPDTPFEY